ncbi:PREDICTED: uncharacterized protein LOC104807708 isoform X1 [Tarenaya hassleriana]|uniref:uncharacterized protein LOC104807708 isoform X1 n=1 Tax=Tarenaya hassleriana TaxID=28532 RepID=UPI00053C3FDA|nr:PREDICTED: uncharacterized protein LOC104807708 isoform X1 [Tarenaya hassleriana]XP_010531395.1 PREDICTED: uncharacterized protein LOC104807708 isoform X1 [Tarenaya hassleriana]XP_010531397.1 PREDICTED: uncharacterized protein LOC104807708 isoform X1 [Tarenaya hassleriana]XP_010531398.1 PREDICTED: uncharacterized protein LOC104807708 isoform X1 [Tarenaya hassleriana]
MLRKSVLELSSRWSIKRLPRKFTSQQRYLSSSSKNRFASASGGNGFPGPDPVRKPDNSKGNPTKAILGSAVVVGAFLVAYQSGYLDQHLGKGQQKSDETIKSDVVTEKMEAAHHFTAAPSVEDSAQRSTSMDDKIETQPEAPYVEASGGMQTEEEVQSKADLIPEQSTFSPSNQDEMLQESTADKDEGSLPVSSDRNLVSEYPRTDSHMSAEISSEAKSVKLEAEPKPVDNAILDVQSSSINEESMPPSASAKDHTSEKAPKDGIEQEVDRPASLLDEYHLKGSDSGSTVTLPTKEHLTEENEALVNTIDGLKDGNITEDGKLILDFLAAIHAAEKRQAELDSQVFAEELRALKEQYENELRDLRARELMRIEEAAILDKELKRERTKAAAAIKAIQEKMEDKLRREIEQKETEAQLALEKTQELAKAELASAIAREKASQIEKMAEADLNIQALCMAFYARSEEARKSHSVHKLALGALALDDALSKGLPIQKEVDVLQTYLEGIQKDSILDLVLSSLPEETRSDGTDTILQLNQKFNTLKGTLRHFSLIPPGGGGILAHSLAHLASWLKFKETDLSGEGIEAVIRRVDECLAEGKLAEAATVLEEGVRGSQAEEIVSEWVRRARNRAITEQALMLLQSYATCSSLT